jgi:hypothetical protein
MSRRVDLSWTYYGYEARDLHDRLRAAVDGANLAPLGRRDAERLRRMIEKLAPWAPPTEAT